MDDDVLRAKARWPDVPAAWGWLYLDRRGQWRLIDRGAPGFDPLADARGEPIRHAALIDFIARNYACTAQGQWFFQNGPQQVFVDLELAPIIFRVASSPTGAVLLTHTGERVARVGKLGADADGNVWALTDLGPGVLDDRQLATLLSHSSSAPSPPSAPSVPGAPSPSSPSSSPSVPGESSPNTTEAIDWIQMHGHESAVPIYPFEGDAAQAFGFQRRPREG